MEFSRWSPPASEGREASALPEEWLLSFDRARERRVLVIPALFDEANKLRRFTLAVMRALDGAGIDSALPDWPGCHESLEPLAIQTLARWRACALQIASHFEATHVLAIRAGALLAPDSLPGWRYAALDGAKLLAGMLRAQTIAEREAGRSVTREALLKKGRIAGLTLGGWELGAPLVRELEATRPISSHQQSDIEPERLGAGALWLRAEPGEDPDQSAALARLIAADFDTNDEAAS